MKIKNKGKVHPSPSPSSSSSSSSPSPSTFVISGSTTNRDALSVLNLLPAAILALASILSLQDREVLAYMITRSMKTTTTTTTTTNPSSAVNDSSKKKCKKPSNNNGGSASGGGGASHKPPLFDCDCFDCYTCYWFRWDSSPNRELIHQAIEAFEDHLSHGEQSKKINAGRGKRKDKPSRRLSDSPAATSLSTKTDGDSPLPSSVEDDLLLFSPGKSDGLEEVVKKEEAAVNEYREMAEEEEVMETAEAVRSTTVVAAAAANNHNHKGFARKVMPDVLGLFNSRLWNLWGPNV